MRKIDQIRQFPRIEWKPVFNAPINEVVLILVDDNSGNLYTELAWLNECREWVDVPHYHKVIGWCEVSEKINLT